MSHSSAFRAVFCAFLLVGGLVLSTLTPPLQSPDEGSHLARAYFLANGGFLLERQDGAGSSGGRIDLGWVAFNGTFSRFPFNPAQKLTAADVAQARSIRHHGTRAFFETPGVGYYFPLIYLPQATALFVGERLDLPIHRTYKLARLLALAATVGLLFAALRLYPVNPLALGLLVLPMSLFQSASCSMDALTYAVATLVLCLFMKVREMGAEAPERYFLGLAALLFVLGTTRLHMFPLLSLLPGAYYFTRRRRHLVVSFCVVAGVIAWTLAAAIMTTDTRIVQGASKGAIALYYVLSPASFLGVLGNTLATADITNFYYQSFLGNLGWLDTPLHGARYSILFSLLSLVGLSAINVAFLRRHWRLSLFLLGNVVLAVLLTFFALLTTWTPHPATVIEGVQGRYFMLPALVLAFALGPAGRSSASVGESRIAFSGRGVAGLLLLGLLALYSLSVTVEALVSRYYLHP
jgi:uncharacterized membrane protein